MAEAMTLSYEDILNILPHRYPFLLVDGVEELVPNEKITAYKNVSFNDNFFQGHFPGNPVMPGVLQVEAMAQAAGLMALADGEKTSGEEEHTMLFMGADKVKWRGVVRPGDKFVMEIEMIKQRRNTIVVDAKGYVNGKLVSQAELMCMVS